MKKAEAMKFEAEVSFDSYIDGECQLEYEKASKPKSKCANLTVNRSSLSPIKECTAPQILRQKVDCVRPKSGYLFRMQTVSSGRTIFQDTRPASGSTDRQFRLVKRRIVDSKLKRRLNSAV